MSFDEFAQLPLSNHEQQMLDAEKLTKLGISNIKGTLGPYKLSEKIPSEREDGGGFGGIVTGYFDESGVRFEMDLIDIIFKQ